MIQNAPSDTPMATPSATVRRKAQTEIAPSETELPCSATAISDGSAIMVANPMAAANA